MEHIFLKNASLFHLQLNCNGRFDFIIVLMNYGILFQKFKPQTGGAKAKRQSTAYTSANNNIFSFLHLILNTKRTTTPAI
jgi:hypothetical protein